LSQSKTTQDEVQDEEQEQISDQAEEELQEINEEVAEESVLEALEDTDEPDVVVEETTKEEVIQESKDNGIELPENIQKVVDFMNETGGSLEDYVRLNTDFDQLSSESLLQEYYKQTKSHLDPEEIEFLIEDNFSYDEDLDEERDIRRKKLAYKEEIAKAKQFLEESKAKYYDEVKLNSKLLPDQQKAIDFFNRYNQEQSETRVIQEKQIENFKNKTDSLFSDNFKGFDFKVGEQKYRFNVKDAQSVKDKQSDINNFIGKFLDENNMLSDASGYHKALFVANNADAIVNHFYEQGKADAVKQISTEAKNINMDPRKTSQGIIETGGIKVKAISGDDSSKLRIKLKK